MRVGECLMIFGAWLVASVALAQGTTTVAVDDVSCLPIGENAVAWATVDNNVPDTTVRLYFRRLHDTVEDLYYVRMEPDGNGRYWGTFPQPQDRMLDRHDLERQRREIQDQPEYQGDDDYSWANWWRSKEASDHRDPNDDLDDDLIRERASRGKQETRHWMRELDDEAFEDWLDQLENEPAEYFAAVYDGQGQRIAQSPMRVAEVRSDCRVDLTEEQAGLAANLTVGETEEWQRGEEIFHWKCDGIVSRIDPNNVLRGDSVCRTCVIAWWMPAAAAIAPLCLELDECGDDPGEGTPLIVSPSAP